MDTEKRRKIYEVLRAANPTPTLELEYSTPFELLIAALLSAQAKDASVNKATRDMFSVANTPRKMLLLGEEGIINYIKTIGLYRVKARNIIKTCQILLTKYLGQIPNDRSALEGLPGVGRKTANVVLNAVFGMETIAVDTHVFRVANRTGLAFGKNIRKVEEELLNVTSPEFIGNAHHWLLLHGRYVCKARLPKCYECIIETLCEYHEKRDLPTKRKKT